VIRVMGAWILCAAVPAFGQDVSNAAIANAVSRTAGYLVTVRTSGPAFAIQRHTGRLFTARSESDYCEFDANWLPPPIAALKVAPVSSFKIDELDPDTRSIIRALADASRFDTCEGYMECTGGGSCLAVARDSSSTRGPSRIVLTPGGRSFDVIEMQVESDARPAWLDSLRPLLDSLPRELTTLESLGENGVTYVWRSDWHHKSAGQIARRLIQPSAVPARFVTGSATRRMFFRSSIELPSGEDLLKLFRAAAMNESQWAAEMRVSPAIAFMED
jgi:hypothetical protein